MRFLPGGGATISFGCKSMVHPINGMNRIKMRGASLIRFIVLTFYLEVGIHSFTYIFVGIAVQFE